MTTMERRLVMLMVVLKRIRFPFARALSNLACNARNIAICVHPTSLGRFVEGFSTILLHTG